MCGLVEGTWTDQRVLGYGQRCVSQLNMIQRFNYSKGGQEWKGTYTQPRNRADRSISVVLLTVGLGSKKVLIVERIK